MWFLLFYRPVFRHSHHQARIRQSGFTLIELLLIVVMIGVLSIAAINAFDGNEEQARENITQLEMVELQKALLQFRRDNRELPCRIYRFGIYNPLVFRADFGDAGFIDQFTLPAGAASSDEWRDWCQGNLKNSGRVVAANGLYALNTFPYEIADFADLSWNRNSQTGWNGPYISQEGLTDAWGKPYLLLEPELTFDQTYRCEDDAGSYAIDATTGHFICVSANDPGFNAATDILPADIARIASKGPDGILDSHLGAYTLTTDDPCVARNDDFVLCLLR